MIDEGLTQEEINILLGSAAEHDHEMTAEAYNAAQEAEYERDDIIHPDVVHEEQAADESFKEHRKKTTEILSQDEIDALLSAISKGEVGVDDYSSVGEQRKVRIVDFRRKDFLSKRQVRNLQVMHENFARIAAVRISAETQGVVFMHVGSVDQLTYEEFMRSIPNPTACSIINMDPLRGSAVLEIDPGVTYTMLDLLFGGSGEPEKRVEPELTDIELSTMEGQVVRLLGCLREVWSGVLDLRPRLGNIECNPRMAMITHPKEMCVLITIETKIGDVEGMMNILYPMSTLNPILHKLKDINYGVQPADEIPLDFPLRVRYGFKDVFVPFDNLPGFGETIMIGKMPQFQVRYNDLVLHVFKDSEIASGKDKG